MKRSFDDGFSIIELLVAVVIMSIGILGMAGLQIRSLQQNRSALLLSEATQRANDILERISANPDIDYSGVVLTDTPTASRSCVDNTCDETAMKDYDIVHWQCSINSLDENGSALTVCDDLGIFGSMPGGAGAIALTDGIYGVTVQWVDTQRVDVDSGMQRSITIRTAAP